MKEPTKKRMHDQLFPKDGEIRYFIEYPDGKWLKNGERGKTNEPRLAMYFSKYLDTNGSKTDAESKSMAKLYLYLNNAGKSLIGCKVTEHKFTD